MFNKAMLALSFGISLNAVAENYTVPTNIFGQPEIGGVWSNATTTKFTRPDEFGDQLILTEAQAAKLEGRAEAYRAAGNKRTDPSQGVYDDGNTSAGYNRFWTDPGTGVVRVDGKPRSSMVTFPKNGQLPTRKKSAAPYPPQRLVAEAERSDNPETRGLSERCVFFNTSAGPVMRPTLYNNNYRISQGRDAVVIVVEMSHEARIVRLNEKHNPVDQNKWMGDSVGRYEGNTLVVETINYNDQQSFYGASEDLKVTERFTRVADDRLLYQFTVEDPKTWSEPWGGEYEFWASPEQYEYACHEGNIGLEGILAGARAEERREKSQK
ncbi:hypothetical protein NBRC116494_29110 [Aurantivibrio plasticivorans]